MAQESAHSAKPWERKMATNWTQEIGSNNRIFIFTVLTEQLIKYFKVRQIKRLFLYEHSHRKYTHIYIIYKAISEVEREATLIRTNGPTGILHSTL